MPDMEKLTTIEIEEKLARFFNYRQNIIVPNISWGFYIHECDLLILRRSGHLLEVEIKVTRADLKKDQRKEHGHIDHNNRIKELWFAIPEYLQDSIDCIPERAGILVLSRNNDMGPHLNCRVIKEARVNNQAVKLCLDEKLAIARLGTLRIWSLKRKIIDMKNGRKRKRINNKNQLKLFQ